MKDCETFEDGIRRGRGRNFVDFSMEGAVCLGASLCCYTLSSKRTGSTTCAVSVSSSFKVTFGKCAGCPANSSSRSGGGMEVQQQLVSLT